MRHVLGVLMIFAGLLAPMTAVEAKDDPIPSCVLKGTCYEETPPRPRHEVDVPHESLEVKRIPAPLPEDAPVDPPPEGAIHRLNRALDGFWLWLFGPEPEPEMRCYTDKFGAKICKLTRVERRY